MHIRPPSKIATVTCLPHTFQGTPRSIPVLSSPSLQSSSRSSGLPLFPQGPREGHCGLSAAHLSRCHQVHPCSVVSFSTVLHTVEKSKSAWVCHSSRGHREGWWWWWWSSDHITPHLQTLHWLPVDARIQYKICSLCFNAVNSFCRQYLADPLKIYAPSRRLRSSADTCTLCIPSVHTKSYSQRAFSHTAPTLWNNLSKAIQNSDSALSFKSAIKTDLFQLYN